MIAAAPIIHSKDLSQYVPYRGSPTETFGTYRSHTEKSRIPKIATGVYYPNTRLPDFVWIRGTSHGLPDLQVVLDINTPTVRGLISKAVRPGLLDFHRDIDNANGDRYAEMKTVCDDPEDHTIRGWYNGSEKVKARILDLKKLTQDQFNDTLDAEEEDGYHEHGQEAGQDGGNFQEYRDSSLDFNKKSSAFVPLEEAPAHGW
ncbi:hypothetical protein CGGC5_v017334 [Colletotrichum fructicola Nara gc5]|uniref:Uncharacterized protein n=1 Tax=Colletotrichum fructicola (strain Nara gc5) TaxID=1213859 RepID=A0A7J6IC37_COLFN|nr:hypothetical protein CGGC5_v017334 [Colletotrichum fructicola Nara gc5]